MATKIVSITYQLKRGLQSVIEAKNPILAEGEPIVIFCNDGSTKLKIGEGKSSTYLEYVLVDDEGNEVEFELLDVIEYENEEYVLLIENNEDAEGVIILKIESLDDETENYVGIDDEEILSNVFEAFKEKYKDEFDFE